MRIMVTGGCGFVGHHFIEHLIKFTDWEIVVLDKLSYSSWGYNRLKDINCFNDKRIFMFASDFTQPIKNGLEKEIGQVDYLVHMGAETHVDKSIENPEPFVMSNVLGTMHILNFANRQKHLKKMIYFSTDEVFGPAPLGVAYKEWDNYNSSNPYAAAKAGGEELCLAYANTYKTPVLITHTMNVIGERQDPEKFIPSTIKKIILGKKVIIHSNPKKTKAASRFYIHARNVSSALSFLLDKGQLRDKYNIVGEREVDCLELAKLIANILDKPLFYEMVDFHSSRPGHDLRYALDGAKLKEMGWEIPKKFIESLEKVIKWYFIGDNIRWLGL